MKTTTIGILALVVLLSAGMAQALDPTAYIWQREKVVSIGPGSASLKAELAAHVAEMLTAGSPSIDNGYLQPAYYRVGIIEGFLLYGSPAETVYVLCDVYPLLEPAQQTEVRTYLQGFMGLYPPLTHRYVHGTHDWGSWPLERNRREFYPMPPDYRVNIWPPPAVPLEVLYVMWKYADTTDDWNYLSSHMSEINTFYGTYDGTPDRYGEIMGLVGMARIAEHFSNTATKNDAVAKATTAINAADYDAWLALAQGLHTDGGHDWCWPIFHYMREAGTVGMYFCPEIGRLIGTEQAADAIGTTAVRLGMDNLIDNGRSTYPAWFAFRGDYCYGEFMYQTIPGWGQNAQGGENAYNAPDFAWAFFMLRAYLFGDSADDLAAIVDMPTCIGDLCYMQKLAVAIRAYGTRGWVDVRAGADTTPPTVTGAVLNGDEVQRSYLDLLALTFSEDVGGSMVLEALSLHNLMTDEYVDLASIIRAYDPGTETAFWSFAGMALDDGNYVATLLASEVMDGSFNPLDGNGDTVGGDDYALHFGILGGDTSGDGAVDLSDLGILATNYGQSGVRIPGDMNGDGSVNLSDLGILASNYGDALPSAVASSAPRVQYVEASSAPEVAEQLAPTQEKVEPPAPEKPRVKTDVAESSNFELTARVRNLNQLRFRDDGRRYLLLDSGSRVQLIQRPGRDVLGESPRLGRGQWYRLRIRCVGGSVAVKLWLDGAAEPLGWTIQATSALKAGTNFRFISGGGSSVEDVKRTPLH